MIRITILLITFTLFPISSFAEIERIEPVTAAAAHGMYVTADKVWLADTFKKVASTSHVYDLGGRIVPLTPNGQSIAGIAKHPDKDLFSFCDLTGSKVILQDSNGKIESTIPIQNPWVARWTPSGSQLFAVTYAGSVIQLLQDGSQKEILKDLDAPFDIALLDENRFWVSEQGTNGDGRVCLYERTSMDSYQKVTCNKNIPLSNPEGLWPLKDGSVAVVDTETGDLLKIDSNGNTEVLEKNLGIPILVQFLTDENWVVYTNRSTGPVLIYGRSKF